MSKEIQRQAVQQIIAANSIDLTKEQSESIAIYFSFTELSKTPNPLYRDKYLTGSELVKTIVNKY